MNNGLIKKLRNIVEDACKSDNNIFGYGIWSHHIAPMIEISGELAKKCVADIEIVEIATILHDYAGIKNEKYIKEHHLYGAIEAEKILLKENYPIGRIKIIKNCIKNHRSSVNNHKGTIEEICVADADAIVHIDQIESLFYVVYARMNLSIDEGKEWIRKKLIRDWDKMSDLGKEYIGSKYSKIIEIIG